MKASVRRERAVRYLLQLIALLAFAVGTHGCGIVTAKSSHTVVEAKASVTDGMPITELTQWAGVPPTVISVYEQGSLVPVGHILRYNLADGTLHVIERRDADGVPRASAVKVEP